MRGRSPVFQGFPKNIALIFMLLWVGYRQNLVHMWLIFDWNSPYVLVRYDLDILFCMDQREGDNLIKIIPSLGLNHKNNLVSGIQDQIFSETIQIFKDGWDIPWEKGSQAPMKSSCSHKSFTQKNAHFCSEGSNCLWSEAFSSYH